jgi:hypothetical protein
MSAQPSEHPSEWTLSRLHAGELPAAEATRTRTHAASCERCGNVLREAEEAQRRFEAEHPFDRFAEGVERAAERAGKQRQFSGDSSRRWVGPLVAMAATVLVVVAVPRVLNEEPVPGVRTKGGATAELRVGGGADSSQRVARTDAPEALAQGERVRLGYTPDTRKYVLALSVDAAGEVTPLYPESGQSLPVEPGVGTHWLPGSLEFTGTGAERVVLVLTDTPVTVEDSTAAARKAFEAGGRDVAKMPALGVAGDQTHWMLLKP